jgi:hypothetical protein
MLATGEVSIDNRADKVGRGCLWSAAHIRFFMVGVEFNITICEGILPEIIE